MDIKSYSPLKTIQKINSMPSFKKAHKKSWRNSKIWGKKSSLNKILWIPKSNLQILNTVAKVKIHQTQNNLQYNAQSTTKIQSIRQPHKKQRKEINPNPMSHHKTCKVVAEIPAKMVKKTYNLTRYLRTENKTRHSRMRLSRHQSQHL